MQAVGKSPGSAVWPAIFVVLGVGAVCTAFWSATVDDAFISAQYARQLVAGNGLVFNPGEYVEGYSNPLFVLLMAAMLAVGLSPIVGAKLLGIACVCVTALLVARLARGAFGLPQAVAVAVALLLGFDVGAAFYATSGMETPLYGLLATLVAYAVVRGDLRLAAVATAAAALCRPDGVVLMGPFVLAFGLGVVRRPDLVRSLWFALPFATMAGWLVFRVAYYGAWLPNTFVAKVGDGANWGLGGYLRCAEFFAVQSLFHGVLAVAAAGGAVVAAYRLRATPPRSLALLSVVPVLHLMPLLAGGDWMNFSRFFQPSLAITLLFAGVGLSAIVSRWRFGVPAVLSVCVVVAVHDLGWIADANRRIETNRGINPAMHSRSHIALAEHLQRVLPAGATVVFNEIGAVSYLTDFRVIDMLGLTDRDIAYALTSSDAEAYATHIAARGPDAVLVNDRENAQSQMHIAHAILYQLGIQSGWFEHVETFPLNAEKNVLILTRTGALSEVLRAGGGAAAHEASGPR